MIEGKKKPRAAPKKIKQKQREATRSNGAGAESEATEKQQSGKQREATGSNEKQRERSPNRGHKYQFLSTQC